MFNTLAFAAVCVSYSDMSLPRTLMLAQPFGEVWSGHETRAARLKMAEEPKQLQEFTERACRVFRECSLVPSVAGAWIRLCKSILKHGSTVCIICVSMVCVICSTWEILAVIPQCLLIAKRSTG